MENKLEVYDESIYWINEIEKSIESEKFSLNYYSEVYKIKKYSLIIDSEIGTKLKAVCKDNKFLMYSFLVASMKINLSKYICKKCVTVGIPFYNINNSRKIVYSKVLPLTSNINYDDTYKKYMVDIKNKISEIYEKQEYLNKYVLDQSGICKDIMDLTPISICMRSFHEDKYINYITSSSKNEISFLLELMDDKSIKLDVLYNGNKFSQDTINNISRTFKKVLDMGLNDYDKKISNIDILEEHERTKILYEFNNNTLEYPKSKTIYELFEEQVDKTPDNVAISFEGKSLTYKELNKRANILGRELRSKGVKANSIVGIMAERSIEMIIAILGILKSGGTYLPIDTTYPPERIEYMLSDSKASILLSTGDLIGNISFNGEVVNLFNDMLFDEKDFGNLEKINNSNDLAYIIYTSGTTGKPKGVMVKHYSLVNYCSSIRKKVSLTSQDETALLSSYAFDLGYTTLFTALVTGIKLNIISEENYKNPYKLIELLKTDITYVKMTPSLFNIVVNSQEDEDTFKDSKLRLIILGGEPINIKDIEKFIKMNGTNNISIMNHYGPTESTIGCIATIINPENLSEFNNVIGKPLNNIKTYILDKFSNVLPIGIQGELCISGEGLARGYLNREDLTKENFIDNPFEPGTKMYKTGDLARWLQNGNIEFVGRIDNQVKIRGFRIELGEIESKILQHENIKETTVVVIDGENGDKQICSYIVSDKEVNQINLRDYLKEILPEYMIPSYFIKLDKMPITPNGKLDRRALPKPNLEERLTHYEEPRNDLEKILVKIWSDVLGIEKLGINDSFFELGGHSLKAMTLLSKIHKETNKEVPLKEIFKSPTIKGLSKFIEESEESIYSRIEKVEEREYYEASSAQKRMYVIQGFDKESVAYNMPQVFQVRGDIEKAKIEDTFKKLVQRHEALRTYFEIIQDKIVQKVDNDYEFNLDQEVSNKPIEEVANDFVKPFDLEKAPLFRVKIVETQETSYLLIDMHHIISDGVSRAILINEFVTLYNNEELEPLRLQYRDFALWQNNFLNSYDMKRQEEYWINMFEDEIPVLNMPTDYERPAVQSFEGDSVSFEVDKNLLSDLKDLTKKTGTTMHMVLLSTFTILLSKYSGQDDIVVGTPIAGRPHADLQNIMGMFVNTLALRNKPNGNKVYLDFLNEVKENALKSYDNQSYQLETLIEKLDIPRNVSRNPLFDVMFNMVDTVANIEVKLNDIELIPYGSENNEAKFDLTLNVMEQDNEIIINIGYCSKLFNKSSVELLGKHYLSILESITKNNEIKLGEIELLSVEEKNKILYEFNNTKSEYPIDKTIHELFEEQVEKTPNNIAVEFEDKQITYRQLNEKANSLATILREKGVGIDHIVSIMAERSIDMIVGIMAILKSGASYLPIDPKQPKDRIKYTLEECEVKILLTQSEFIEDLNYGVEIIDLQDEKIYEKEKENLNNISNPNSLAYIIYTSGSTGLPKGVMIEHKGVVRLVKNTNYISVESKDVLLQLSNYAFDGSVFDIYASLLNGAKLVLIAKDNLLEIDKLGKVILDKKVSVFFVTTALFNTIVDTNMEYLKNIRKVLFGGERISVKHAKKALEYLGTGHIVHVYGPTEGTVYTTYHFIDTIENDAKNIPIGKSISNSKAYVLGKNNELLPIGIPGELCIGGDGIARGYLKRPELTDEKFINNPFKSGEKIYKTGDLVRWLPDGSIEFLGRIDNQVKIRGFRIELGEIENSLLTHEDIKGVAVTVEYNEEKEKYICAYVVSEQQISNLNLRSYLKEILPEYMIPTFIIQVEKIALTANGKLDKRSLPKPNLEVCLNNYEAPRNDLEEKLVKIWSEVLGVNRVGINDSFFELGGHSLKAMALVSKIHKETNKVVPLKELFKWPTIKGLSRFIDETEESIYSKIEKVEEREYYETSSAQKRMYIIQGFDKESMAYNMPQVFQLEGSINKSKIENAFKVLAQRHEALRTYFENVEDEIVQKIDSNYEFNLKQEVSNKSIEEIFNEFVIPFELGKAPLFRAEVVENQGKTYLLIDMHHIISDGVSMSILINEFATLYNGGNLESLKLQYKDFAVWQNNFLKLEEMKKQEEYWLNMFKDEIPVLNMATDYERPAVQSFEGDSVSFEVGENLSSDLRNLTQKTGTTMHMVLLSAFNILLSKYSGQEDIVVGTPIAGRPHTDLQNIMGMFVNTLALRNKPEGTKKYVDFLSEVKENSLKAYDNQSYQLETLIEKLNIPRDASRNPLFDVMFNMVDTISNLDIKLNDMTLIPYGSENNVAKFDLTLNAIEQNDEINISIGYCSKLFNKDSVERLGKHYLAILDSITKNNEIKLEEIDLLGNEEKNFILNEFNSTKMLYPDDKTIHQLFETQVEKNPNNIAVIFEDKKLNYKELNEKANSLARILRDNGVKADSIVGIMIDRSLEMIIGIMGILKAGGAYLPIDPKYPKDRIEYILKDSETNILLSKSELIESIEFGGMAIDLFKDGLFNRHHNNLEPINNSKNLAYVIYTSGTTGKPKGAMIEHRALVNRLLWMQDKYPLNEEDTILQKTTYTFDVSVWELLWWSLVGAKVCMLSPNDEKDPVKIIETINKNRITTMHFVPSMLDVFLYYLEEKGNALDLNSLKQVFSSGEALNFKQVSRFYKQFDEGNKKLINLYGPTEATIDVSYFDTDSDSNVKIVPIGKPISNINLYILDSNRKLQPIGVSGELYIAGDGLSRGYLNKPELTAEKFIDNPFEAGTKMYKTGDLARWLPDGNIEFLGRIDNQVKIRGFRIELGEIESKILQHEDVKEATVIVIDGKENDKYICSYIVSEKEVRELNLRDHLKESLPEYMIPSYFVKLDKMPITSNGKLDRRALPKPNLDERLIKYEAPRCDLEEILVKIWSEVLGVEKIGINDSFFELGGHSLKAMTLISKIHKETNKEVPLKELFKSPTIKGLRKFIEEAEESGYSRIEKVEEREYYEASSAQKRMYIIQGFDKESMSYNMPQLFEIKGSVDKAKIEETFKKLAQRHESLRTYFETVEDEIVQKIDSEYEFKLKEKVSNKSIEEIFNEFVIPFNLGKASLFRAEVAEAQGKSYLLIDMHHIISDGVSMSILINEFATLYNGGRLDELKLQYRDFAVWQNNFLKLGDMKKQEEYWLDMFKDEIPVLNIATDYERPTVQSFEGDSVSFEVGENLVSELRNITQKTGTTMHMVLLSAFNILLSKYSGQEDIVVGTPIAGRQHADLQNIMGMFVNTLALRNKPEGTKKYVDFLREVKENSLKAYDNQSYQLETLIEKLDITRDTSRNPLFDVMFNMIDTVSDIDIKLNDMALIPYSCDTKVSKFDLTLNAIEQNCEINISIVYCSKLFNRNSVEKLGKHYLAILDSITKNNEINLGEIELLNDGEKNLILNKFNDTKIEYPNDKTIQELFELQVEKTPDNIAVMFEGKKLTYRELNEKANSLARSLIIKGVESESVVGIISYKSLEMIIGLIAILKAGAVYLPIDINYPKDRIEYMMNDSKSNVLLNIDDRLTDIDFKGQVINISNESLFDGCVDNLDKINSANSLAYVIYTSGTTGRPKGVMCEHKNVIRLVKNTNYIEFKYDDKILQTGSMSFDASTFEVWGALLNGLELHLAKNEVILIAEKLEKFIYDNNITILWLTSQLFNQLVQDNINIFKNLRYLLVGGDVISPKYINLVRGLNKNLKIINGYGPTENTTFSTTYLIDKEYNSNIPIGKPIANSKVYIVDRNEKLLPIGLYGELCVSGDGLARGYLNNFKLTNEKFIDNPFEPGTKMYKTGDLARWLPDGNIEFLGRIDNQVKIRGFRIELGEIESKILQHEDVKEATVIVIDGKENDKYICSYIVSEKEVSELNLRDHLKESLPEYMIPSYFVKLDKMPITSNGKLDRRALPKPNLDERLIKYEAPRSDLEEILVKIWSEVLGVEKIGINDSFFELGGHSLKAMTLISKIHKETNKEVTLKELFKWPTIKGLSKFIEDTEESIYSKIEKVEEREYYESSSAQKRMYIIQGFDKESMAYNMPQVFQIEGSINQSKIEDTFKKLAQRHEALRTYFEIFEDEIVQKIDGNYEFKLSQEVSNQSIEEIASDFIKPFDLSKAPLFRAKVVEAQGKTYLLIDMHHIISDGVSMSILINEFATLYNGGNLESLKLQYKDFAVWQNNFLKLEEMKKQEEYWLNMFKDEIPVLNMATDYERPAVQSFEGDSVSFEVGENLSSDLRNLTQKTGTTMHMVLLSAFNILLSKYSGQDDIVVGTPIAGRPHADLQNIMGMFVNTLALRNRPEVTKKYVDFLSEVKENSLKAYDNQSYQLETLIEKLNIPRDASRNPLFDVMFNMVDTISNLDIKLNDMILIAYGNENNVSKFDLTLNAIEQNDEINISIGYCSKLFNKDSIEKLGKRYLAILDSITKNNEIKLGEIELLNDEEKQLILNEFNDTKTEYSSDKTIQELFESQVEQMPENIAVILEDKKLTYRELNEKANSLARILRDKGVKADSIVAIMVERSLEMIIGMLGVLKAGGAYLPIDPSYPKQRIEYMIKDSGSEVLLTEKSLINTIEFNGQIIESLQISLLYRDNENLDKINNENNLAYVIYTSGTTGNPKGTMIKHSNLNNFITSFNRRFNSPIGSNDKVLSLTNYAFDVSVCEIFVSLTNGSTLVINDKHKTFDPIEISNLIVNNEITFTYIPPLLLTNVYEELKNSNREIKLNKLLVGVEAIRGKTLKNFYELNKDIEIINGYGPTEATICSTLYKVNRDENEDRVVSIGSPVGNTRIYILNNDKLQPIGVPGELCISGDGVARGYLNKPELTSEKFVDNPFDLGTNMYRTGDMARWLIDGNIEFLGRMDNQVKIRGFRIELGEIESRILQHEDVKESTVLVIDDKDSDKYICAYIVSDKEISELNLRDYLKESLPEYMVPSCFVRLDRMPITSNGKLDKKALPKPNLDERLSGYEGPRNEIEKSLVDIWKEILNIKEIGINDNFFEMGGHSLKATKLISRVNKEFNVEISIKDVFYGQTIKELAEFIAVNKKLSTNISNDDAILLKNSDGNLKEKEENLFIIHDGSGDIGGYIELASNLKGNIKCWAIKVNKEVIYNKDNFTIEELSQKYINIIKNIQPHGYYNIAGWSLGGVIAFEMTRQLEKKGDEINKLVLIDSYINPKMINYNKVLKEDVSLNTEKKNLISYINNNDINEKIYKELSLDKKWNVAKETISKEDLDQIKLSLPKKFISMIPNIGELNLDELLISVNIIRRLNNALKSYKPKSSVKTQAILYKAKEESNLNVDKWNKYFQKYLVVDEVSGNHYTIVNKGNIEYIADKLNKLL